ncbi:MAG: hypothetical protein K2W78_00245 [Xanthobacteraceae bacterium]|nr:hypothetical protein [Xanthobacteraceae bacterium]
MTLATFTLCAGAALAADDDDKPATAASQLPNIYLDVRTNYVTVPAGTLAIGFGNFNALPALSSLSSLSGQGVALELPLTVDVNEHLSVFGGVTASTTKTDATPWTSFDVASWNVGFQADLYEQNGGSIPGATLLSTLTRSAVSGPFATTSFVNTLEFDYALNEDETKGFLAGVQLTNVLVDSGLASIKPAVIGYVGAYYQWPNNWKLTGRAGVQSFGGANISALAPFLPAGRSLVSLASFTEPVLRADIDRMDDNDNRLFGVTATVYWTPKPAFQFILRTPLYLVRN